MSQPLTPLTEEALGRLNPVKNTEPQLRSVIGPAIVDTIAARGPDDIICQIEADQNLTREQMDFLIYIQRANMAMMCLEEFDRRVGGMPLVSWLSILLLQSGSGNTPGKKPLGFLEIAVSPSDVLHQIQADLVSVVVP
jgi:hypothetical protein